MIYDGVIIISHRKRNTLYSIILLRSLQVQVALLNIFTNFQEHVCCGVYWMEPVELIVNNSTFNRHFWSFLKVILFTTKKLCQILSFTWNVFNNPLASTTTWTHWFNIICIAEVCLLDLKCNLYGNYIGPHYIGTFTEKVKGHLLTF